MKQIKCPFIDSCREQGYNEIACLYCNGGKEIKKTIKEYEREIKRLKAEAEMYKDEAELEHNSAMDWFEIACQYKYDNDDLRAKLDKALELPYMEREISASGTYNIFLYYMANGKLQREWFNSQFPEQLEARLKELKENNNDYQRENN